MSIPIITVTGHLRKPDGTPCSGFIDFIPNIEIQDSVGNIIVPTVPVTATLSGGNFSVGLYATNDPSSSQTGVVYKVIERVNESPDNSYNIIVNYNAPGGTIDLADIAPPISGTPQYIYASAVELASHEQDPNAHSGTLTPGGLGTNNLWTGTNTWTGPENHSGVVTYTGNVNFGGSQTNTGDVYFRSGRPWVDVRAYGATGDGVADDTVAIQTAVTACGVAGGGIVYAPLGTYLLGSTITVPRAVQIRGSGMLSTIFQPKNGTSPAALFDFTGTGTEWDEESSDFGILGYSPNTLTRAVIGIVAERSNMRFNNLRIIGCSSKQIQNLSYYCRYTNCDLYGSSVVGGGDVGLSLEATTGSNGVMVTNCTFSGLMVACIDFPATPGPSTSGVLIIGCAMQGTNNSGVSVTYGIRIQSGAAVQDVIIHGLRVEDLLRVAKVADNNFGLQVFGCGGVGAQTPGLTPQYAFELDGGDHVLVGIHLDFVTTAVVRLNSTARRCYIAGVSAPSQGGGLAAVSDGSSNKNRNFILATGDSGSSTLAQYLLRVGDGDLTAPSHTFAANPTRGLFNDTANSATGVAGGLVIHGLNAPFILQSSDTSAHQWSLVGVGDTASGGVTDCLILRDSTNTVNIFKVDNSDVMSMLQRLVTLASVTSQAGLNLPHGTAPTSPVNGDIWTTSAGMFVRINGVTKTVTLT